MARPACIAFSGENVCKKAVRGVEHATSGFIPHTMSLVQARAEAAERLERIDMMLLIDAMTLLLPPESLDDGI
jgi:hypothetical protein